MNEVSVFVKSVAAVGSVGLCLPDGWFGRPYDTFFRVSLVDHSVDALVVELDDGALRLTFTGQLRFSLEATELCVSLFERCGFVWTDNSTGKQHEEIYTDGSICFIANPVDRFPLG